MKEKYIEPNYDRAHFLPPEPQGWADCEKCEHWDKDIDVDPCSKCLTCLDRCGFKEKEYEEGDAAGGSGGDEPECLGGEDCGGCEKIA